MTQNHDYSDNFLWGSHHETLQYVSKLISLSSVKIISKSHQKHILSGVCFIKMKKFYIEKNQKILHQKHKIKKEIHSTGHNIEEVSVRTNIYLLRFEHFLINLILTFAFADFVRSVVSCYATR